MKNCSVVFAILVTGVFTCCNAQKKLSNQKPNIIIIDADDLGIGDVSSYRSTELLKPNIDRIANKGLKFTNGYATSPTCTPSRYSLLSGTPVLELL